MTMAWGTALTAPVALAVGPGDPPRYFSHPNYANSPLPEMVTTTSPVTSVGNPLVDRTYASDYPAGAPLLVVLPDATLPTGFLQSFQTWNQASQGSSPFPSAGNVFNGYVLRPTGVVPNQYYVVFDSGPLTVPALTTPGVSEVATFDVGPIPVQAGDVLAFSGQGVPIDITATGTDQLYFPTTAQPVQDTTIDLGVGAYPLYPQART
jgi:hypothetical protein